MKTYQYVTTTTNRHGRLVRYFKKRGQAKIRLHAEPGTVEFEQEYQAARDGIVPPTPRPANDQRPTNPLERVAAAKAAQSFKWLLQQYERSPEYKSLKPASKNLRSTPLWEIANTIHPTFKRPFGDIPFAKFERRDVEWFRDNAPTPGKGNTFCTYLSIFLNWSVDKGHLQVNVASRVMRRAKENQRGFHTWTEAECAKYEAAHPVGTQARLAYELIRFLGVRRSDLMELGPSKLRNGEFCFTEAKGRDCQVLNPLHRHKNKDRRIKCPPQLAAIIAATTPIGTTTYLLNDQGNPLRGSRLDVRFVKWAKQAGLPHKKRGHAYSCMMHGIRKRSATDLANMGASASKIQHFGGWSNLKMPALYTAEANSARLAGEAAAMLARRPGADAGNVVALPKRKGAA